jgi:glycerol-3-phosphate acyltransferase PlsX
MRIVVDAMGGDKAPSVEVEGALQAVSSADHEIEVVLVGDESQIKHELARHHALGEKRIHLLHATERIEMGEDPARQVRRKRDASIAVATRYLKEGNADGLVSAGNTGAVVASSLLVLGRLPGVRRPAIATTVPTPSGGAVLLDVGANSDCTPQHLVQFGIMGEIYARKVLGRREPKVGLLNIGEEDNKGNEVVRNTFPLLKSSHLNFIGNVEGRDIFKGGVDVVVCDGFVGNVVLKFSESVVHLITSLFRELVTSDFRGKIGALLMRPMLRAMFLKLDYAEYGGAPLLGVDGAVIIAHGSSSPKAIKNAIFVASRYARERITQHIQTELQGLSLGEVSS